MARFSIAEKANDRNYSSPYKENTNTVQGQTRFKVGDNKANSAITPESLTPTPVINVPTPRQATQQDAMLAQFETQAEDDFTRRQMEQSAQTETTKNTALQDYLQSLKDQKGLATLTAEQYGQPGGVDEVAVELNDINDKIRREQLGLRRSIERVQEKGGGLAAGATAEIGNLERESFAKQADLSVIQMAVQGRYDSAKEIADRAVNAKLEQQQIYNETLKFAYSEAKEAWTTAEQREFETLLANRERKLEEERQNQQSIYELGIQASADGAPQSVVQSMLNAKTREEALALGGQYIGALDRQLKIAQINSANRANQPKASVSAVDIPSFEEYLSVVAPNMSLSPEGRAQYEKEYNVLKQKAVVSNMSPLAGAIAQDPARYNDLSATDKAEVLPALTAAGIKIPKQLNGEQQKAQNLAQSGLQALQEIKGLTGGTDVTLRQSLNPFGQFATQRRGVVDAISRIRTGAAMTPSEEEFYNSLIPGAFDPADTIAKKEEQLAVFFSGIAGNTIVLQSPNGQIYSYDDLMNPDQRKETRDALAAGWTLVDY